MSEETTLPLEKADEEDGPAEAGRSRANSDAREDMVPEDEDCCC